MQLLDFELAEEASEATDPAFVALKRGSAFLQRMIDAGLESA